jgi:hypothetical protein
MNTKNFFLALVILTCTAPYSAFSQSINYKIVDDKPYTHPLEIHITPIDFRFLDGFENLMGGPDISVVFRPLNRVAVEASAGIAPIMTPDNLSGIKQSGGLFLEAAGNYVWLRKGRNLVANKGDQTPLPTEINLKTRNNVRTFIKVPTNRVVERGIRGGGYYYNLPTNEFTTNSFGAFVGLSKNSIRSIKIDAEGYGEKQSYNMIGYHFDVLFGSSDFIPQEGLAAEAREGIGWRFGINLLNKGGLFPIGTKIEIGSLPGGSSFMRLKINGTIAKGSHPYEGKYTYRKAPKGKIAALIRAL